MDDLRQQQPGFADKGERIDAPGAWPRVAPRPPFWPIARSMLRLSDQIRSRVGIRRGVRAGGVYYKELSPLPLVRALSKRGPGYKDYRVTFPGAESAKKVRVRCTSHRVLADLLGPVDLHRYTRLASILRPGMRVLDVSGPPFVTGYAADWLARMVGPSGAVVSLIGDRSGLEFAARRYARDNLAFEALDPSIARNVGGETDGAFDAAIWLHARSPGDEPEADARTLHELLRVVRQGGWLTIGQCGGDREDLRSALREAKVQDAESTAPSPSRDARHSAMFMFVTTPESREHDALIRKPPPETDRA